MQGISEEVSYGIALTPWLSGGETASNLVVVAYDERDWSDVTSKILQGAGGIAANVVTTPTVNSIRLDGTYRIVCTFDVSTGGKRSFFIRVRGER